MPAKKPKVSFIGKRGIAPDNEKTRELYNQGRYGEPIESKKIQYSLIEALYLSEKKDISICDSKNKRISFENFIKKAEKLEPRFWIRYCVYRDLRKRGYIVKTALKFGADFRVYDRGVKPGEEHAKWIVYPVHEAETMTLYEFAAKNRVAHSTRKKLLLAIVDEEGDVTFYEANWIRP
ncbi:MAG: tRNA-intron lyase [Nanoarchaeota archaeon]